MNVLQNNSTTMMYDIIIIGAGPAGLTAATNTAHRGMKTLVLEKQDSAGGLPALLYPDKIIRDHPGFPVGILGKELSRMLYMQAINAGAEIRRDEEAITLTQTTEDHITVTTNRDAYQGRRVILCTGIYNVPKKLEALRNYTGSNVHYAIENPRIFRGKHVVIVGGGDHAFDTAVQLSSIATSVTILVKHQYAKAKQNTVTLAHDQGVTTLYNSEIVMILPGRPGNFNRIQVRNTITNEKHVIAADDLFIAIGFKPIRRFLENNGFSLLNDGSVAVDEQHQTNILGVYAAGDITGEVRLIATACAEGITAAVHAFEEIRQPYWLQ
jgi:thioredoxin reductase (NADPH)